MTPHPPRRRLTLGALAGAVGVLAGWNLLRSWVPSALRPLAAVAVGGVLLMIAHRAAVTAAELGLARRDLGPGVRIGIVAGGVVAGVVLLAAVLPWTRELFDDPQVVEGVDPLFELVVVVPVQTVLFEELAFRGVLLALLRRLTSTPWAVAWCSCLFGLWHLVPELESGVAPAVGTVAMTAVAASGLCWLRLRSGSLVAPALAHLASNDAAFAAALIVTER